MAKYTKQPVTIDAVQFVGLDEGGEPRFSEPAPDWLAAAMRLPASTAGAVHFARGWDTPMLMVHTLEGTHRAGPDDWIIRGLAGELYPCKPDIFDRTYLPAQDGRTPAKRRGA